MIGYFQHRIFPGLILIDYQDPKAGSCLIFFTPKTWKEKM